MNAKTLIKVARDLFEISKLAEWQNIAGIGNYRDFQIGNCLKNVIFTLKFVIKMSLNQIILYFENIHYSN